MQIYDSYRLKKQGNHEHFGNSVILNFIKGHFVIKMQQKIHDCTLGIRFDQVA